MIESGAQIGVNVTILPYVTIGRGAIVGAGSVVTKDIPAGMLAYGNPAVPMRSVDGLGDVTTRLRTGLVGRFGAASPDPRRAPR
jgi:acetyltransferase-like isoleucine patch superfamily enzyme